MIDELDDMRQQLSRLNGGTEWLPGPGGTWQFVTSRGLIIGEVSSAIASGYYATRDGKMLGKFYTEQQAQQAVERGAA